MNDYDPDGDRLTAHFRYGPAHGSVTFNLTGEFGYTPKRNFNGADSFTYAVRDFPYYLPSEPATVRITVTPVNDPPTAHDDQFRVAQNAGPTVADVTANDAVWPDAGETLTVTGVTQPSHGTAQLLGGVVRYMPAQGFSGQDSFTYLIEDGHGGSDSANVSVTVAPPPTARVRFARASADVTEGCVPAVLTVEVEGALNDAEPFTVDYAVTGGTATQRSDYTAAFGTLSRPAPAPSATLAGGRLTFAAGETSRQIVLLLSEDGYAEAPETVTLSLSNPVGVGLGEPASATLNILDNDAADSPTNPIDDAQTFVCQQYHDFLSRQPDAGGLAFWTNEITRCGADAACVREKRVDVSAAFYLSIEHQQTGYFVERLYEACLARRPTYEEFLRDVQRLGAGVEVGIGDWERQLETNRQAFAEEFVTRAEFLRRYPVGLSAEHYADEMFEYAGVGWRTYVEWRAVVEAFGAGDTRGRAAAMRKAMESASVYRHYYNRGFVLAEYFGYLRRDPNDPPDTDWGGYDFWLLKMDEHSLPGEDVTREAVALARVRRGEMVRAFIESLEYRARFGRP